MSIHRPPDKRSRRLGHSATASEIDPIGGEIKSEDRYFSTFSQQALIPRNSAADLRLQRLARSLHELGQRPLNEFLREILGGDVDIWEQLERYARLPSGFIRALGADQLAPRRS